jgi:hypothetical protein
MCTLTYYLTETGYDIFFNRDEQRSRAQALPPVVDHDLNAIYPIDPIGKGTWLAVHQSGVSLALLNYYKAERKAPVGYFSSRGEIILKLLKNANNVIETLKEMQLSCYQPFQLCVFASNLSLSNSKLYCFQWDGRCLTELDKKLPITSSGIEYQQVYEARKIAFKQIVSMQNPTPEALIRYHQSQQVDGKLSVKMSRKDAQTVSFSQLTVNNEIVFEYIDYLNDKQQISQMKRVF